MSQSWCQRYWPAVAFAVVILAASLLPVPESGGEQLPALLGVPPDKWVHATGYGALTLLLTRARRNGDAVTLLAVIVVESLRTKWRSEQ